MNPKTATKMSGKFEFAGARGGEAAGIPILTSRKAPADQIVLVDPNGIALAGGNAAVRVSREGSVQMLDEVTQDAAGVGESPVAPTGTTVVSLWQTNSVGIMTEISANWKTVRSGAVAVMDVSAWTAVDSPAGSPE